MPWSPSTTLLISSKHLSTALATHTRLFENTNARGRHKYVHSSSTAVSLTSPSGNSLPRPVNNILYIYFRPPQDGLNSCHHLYCFPPFTPHTQHGFRWQRDVAIIFWRAHQSITWAPRICTALVTRLFLCFLRTHFHPSVCVSTYSNLPALVPAHLHQLPHIVACPSSSICICRHLYLFVLTHSHRRPSFSSLYPPLFIADCLHFLRTCRCSLIIICTIKNGRWSKV